MVHHNELVAFLDDLLGFEANLDYPGAWNGLQVEGPHEIRRVAVAVDASERIIGRGAASDIDFLIVHHGLFWDPDRRLTGHRFRKVDLLLQSKMGVYASHLPLDRHPEVGNSALLLRGLGAEPEAPFGEGKGASVGWTAPVDLTHAELIARLESHLPGAPIRPFWFGDPRITRVAVVTGSGADFMPEAAEKGIGTLITGEAAHQHFAMAQELHMNLILAGHYATETGGVRAVGQKLKETFGLPVTFLDDPSPF